MAFKYIYYLIKVNSEIKNSNKGCKASKVRGSSSKHCHLSNVNYICTFQLLGQCPLAIPPEIGF